jgi:hypothetical protein
MAYLSHWLIGLYLLRIVNRIVGLVAVVSCGERGIGPELARRLPGFLPVSESIILRGAWDLKQAAKSQSESWDFPTSSRFCSTSKTHF